MQPDEPAFFFDDQNAIKSGLPQDGFVYKGRPLTAGFQTVRQPGECISILFILEDGQVATGDCAAVQYSGVGGRDPLFLAKDFIPFIEQEIAPKFIGRTLTHFKSLAEEIESMLVNGKRLHTAIRYGFTQAILDAVAKAKKVTMAEVIRDEYHTGIHIKRIPIFTQSGDDRYVNVDKMILKKADVIPHGLINNIEKLGENGEKLLQYVEWLAQRVQTLSPDADYVPILHLDVYGNIGTIFQNDIDKMLDYFEKIEQAAKPFHIRLEGPTDLGDRTTQMEMLKTLTAALKKRNSKLELVADEWCNTLEDIKFFADNKAGHMLQIKTPDLGGIHNTVEALLYCKERGIGAYCGGTCNETNRSAEICTHIALACGADQCLAKPGMGFDEGYMIVNNEMNRTLALLQRKQQIILSKTL